MIAAVAMCAALASHTVQADVTLADEYGQRLQIHQTIQPQGPSPFGEQVNPYSGALSFRQTDAVFEGIGPAIRLVRGPGASASGEAAKAPSPAFGSWGLSIPRIETLVDLQGWVVGPSSDPNRLARCSRFDRPTYFGTLDDPQAGWNGMTMITEDGSEQTILKRASQNTRKPTIAEASVFPAVTQDNWQLGCLSSTSNGAGGEAFLAVSPDGTKYWLDRLIYTDAWDIAERDSLTGTMLRQHRRMARMYVTRIEDRFGNWLQYHYNGDKLTSITSKDGRNVAIAWRTDSPVISKVTVQPGTTPARVWEYQYVDITSTGARLSAVILPGGGTWAFSAGAGGGDNYLYDADASKCTTRQKTNTAGGTIPTVTMTAPSGAVGSFTLSAIWHARNYVPSNCKSPQYPGEEFEPYETLPPLFKSRTLTKKVLSGPGLATQTWTYTYPTAVGSTVSDSCADDGTCPTSTWVEVADSKGNKTRYTYSNRWGETEGRLSKTQAYQGASTLLRQDTYTYAAKDRGPWPTAIGGSMMDWRSNTAPQSYWMPLERKAILQQGVTFTHRVLAAGFDEFAREIAAQNYNSQGNSRYAYTTYHDNQGVWVLGQVASSKIGSTLVSETAYGANDLPSQIKAYGKVQQTLTYNADGTLHTTTDGNNHTTTLSSWYRGVPRDVAFEDGTSQSATVNAYGWLLSVTDEAGATTNYGYDAMGQVNKITYPTGDSTVWNATTISFTPVAGGEYGISAGHWRQTVSTGNGRRVTYYDALWRPVLTREYDAGNVAATSRFVATSYDKAGHRDYTAYAMANAPGMSGGYWTGGGDATTATVMTATFAGDGGDASNNGQGAGPPDGAGNPNAEPTPTLCYPQPDCEDPDPPPPPPPPPPSASTLPGTHTTYDALGRVTKVEQDSELGTLITATAYLNNADGYYTRVTNPRGQITYTWYQAYGQPSYDMPTRVQRGSDAYTDIVRDVFGKPEAMTRRNGSGSVAVTRRYYYNSAQELCRTNEPETGDTFLGYDAAGNLAWSAAGYDSTATGCLGASSVAARRIDRSYDARNRPTALVYPDHVGDTTYSYTAAGRLATITADNGGTAQVTTQYTWNRRGLLAHEALLWGSINYPVDYVYNANGHLYSEDYNGAERIVYTPNALGQPTRAGQYATGVSYWPNGAIRQFTYGNGIVHTLAQNARGLPDRSTDAYGSTRYLDDGVDYDGNGNVVAISDGATGRNQRGNRTMSYDALDRLTDVTSPMYGSTGVHYSYDVQDNLTQVTAPGRHWYYCYDAHNQLTNVKTNGCGGATVVGLHYDVQGNLDKKNGTRYTFDMGNRLRSVTASGQPTSSYVYDGHGRRARDYLSGAGSKYSQYDRQGRLVYSSDLRRNLWIGYIYLGGSLVAVRETPRTGGTAVIRYQHTDALGSPVAITNSSRTVTERREYEPYGSQLNAAMTDGPCYTGHVCDAATGLINMQQRYYDPGIGRFLSVDPITVSSVGGNFNRYWYANNNPYGFTDPDGRQSWSGHLCDIGGCGGFNAGSSPRTSFRSPEDSGSILTRETHYAVKPGVHMSEAVESQVSNLADNYHEATGKDLTVTDGSRVANDQAARMFYKITHGEGVRIYRNRAAANEIMSAYTQGVAENLERGQIIANMGRTIGLQMSNGIYISAHLRHGAVDFRSRDMGADDRATFLDVSSEYKVLQEGVPPHFHVEF